MANLAASLPITRPLSDLRTQINDVYAQAAGSQEPVVPTENGIASYMLMDSDAYALVALA